MELLSNFTFSINATMPLFLVMVAGWILKRLQIINDEFVRVSNKLQFNVTLVCLLFIDMKDSNIKENFNLTYVLFCFFATLVCIIIAWAGARLFIKDKSITGEFVQGSYRGSAAVLGIALIANVADDTGMGPVMIVGAVPLYNIFAVLILAVEGNNCKMSRKQMLVKAFKGVCTNPIILSIFAGMFFSIMEWDLPYIVNKTGESIASLTTPLALISIGAGFNGSAAIKMVKPTVVASIIKLIVQPAIFLPVAAALEFQVPQMAAVLVMLGAPTTPSSYIMAKNMGHEGTLTAGIVALTTLLSMFTVTMWIFIMKSFSWI